MSVQAQERNFDFIVKSLLAGGIAGMCSKTTVAPLDRIKILFQAHNSHYSNLGVFTGIKKIVQKESLLALYKGNGAQMVRVFPYAATQFTSFELYTQVFSKMLGSHNHLGKLLAGSSAGATAVLLTYPLDTIRARLAFQVAGDEAYSGIVHAATSIFRQDGSLYLSYEFSAKTFLSCSVFIYDEGRKGVLSVTKSWPKPPYERTIEVFKEGGLRGLYRGFVPTICGMIPYAGLSFYCFEMLKMVCMVYAPDITCAKSSRNTGGLVLLVPAKLMCGGLAGSIAQSFAYPMDVTRRRMQLAMMSPETKKFGMGMVKTLVLIYKENGVFRGLYRGMSINYLRAMPMVAVSFSVYELMKQALNLDTGLKF